MNANDMNTKLEEINGHVNTLFHLSWMEQGRVHENLTRIWTVTCELQRALSAPAVVTGYWQDALGQYNHLFEMVARIGSAPSAEALLSIAPAAELAYRKIEDYRQIVAFSANAGLQAEVSDELDRAAA